MFLGAVVCVYFLEAVFLEQIALVMGPSRANSMSNRIRMWDWAKVLIPLPYSQFRKKSLSAPDFHVIKGIFSLV